MVNCHMNSPYATFVAIRILLITLVLCQQGLTDTGILVGLTEGTYFNEGKVVVYYNGTRGAVCGDGWNDTDAGVVCKQLGFGSPGIAIPFGGGSESVLFGNVTCNGREPTLASCGHGTIRSCTHSEDAGVICLSQDGVQVKLVGGTSDSEGIVKVYYNSQWGTVCDDGWDDTDAAVVCRQLGFGSTGTATRSDNFTPQAGKIWLSNVNCFGGESTIARCAHPGVGIIGSCDHSKDAGVRCSGSGGNDIPVRLFGGTSENEGQVEIYYNSEWGKVCGNEWSDTNVEVLCRQLGYNSNPIGYYWTYFASHDTKPILLDEVICTGSESAITNCGHLGFYVYRSGCNDSTNINVHCYGTPTTSVHVMYTSQTTPTPNTNIHVTYTRQTTPTPTTTTGQQSPNKNLIGAIVGPIISAVIILLAITGIIIAYKCRRHCHHGPTYTPVQNTDEGKDISLKSVESVLTGQADEQHE